MTTLLKEPWSLIAHIGGKCPSCGSADVGRADKETRAHMESYATLRHPEDDAFAHALTVDAMVDFETGGIPVAYRCRNPACPAQMARRVEHIASRPCLDLEGLGGEAAEAVAALGVTSPFDILEWTEDKFANLTWTTGAGGKMTFGQSRAKKLMASIELAKRLPLNRWITACGIPTVGVNTGKEISRLFGSGRCLAALRKEDRCMVAVDAVWRIAHGEKKDTTKYMAYLNISNHLGPVSCQQLLDWAKSDEGARVIALLQGYPSVRSDNHYSRAEPDAVSGKLSGNTFVVTGTLSEPREQIHDLIRKAGGTVASSISAKTTYLVAGDKAGSKLAKAGKLGVQVLTEAQLRAML